MPYPGPLDVSASGREGRIPPDDSCRTSHDGDVTQEAIGFRIHALPTSTLNDVRLDGLDVNGNPVERLVASGGESLRCCLHDAAQGEDLILFGYEPPLPAGPYREVGPIFAHAAPCPGPATEAGYPAEWYGRPQVLRAYDKRGRIHPATRIHDGTAPEKAIMAVLADPEVTLLHSRNIAYGCFMFAATRAA